MYAIRSYYAVRYDGDHRAAPDLISALAAEFALEPICPEVGAGLGVPRPPVNLVRTGRGERALGVDNPELDVTTQLLAWSVTELPGLRNLSGMVLT